jgi:DNA-binding response OmpR family regulator/HPt (histidine-containing phosphotransfer) domain-containing protein
MSDLNNNMLTEFKNEAEEMFQSAQIALLKLNQGNEFEEQYNEIYRALVSLKGAAGLFELTELKNHMQNLEKLFESLNLVGNINSVQVDYLHEGLNSARKLLDGQANSFKYLTLEEFNLASDQKNQFTPPTKEALASDLENEAYKNGILYVIDDEPGIAEILTEIIQAHGFTVKCFYNGKDALKNIEKDNPDAVLIDINMPGFSGLDFIKICNEEKYELPIILISGSLSKEARSLGNKAGAFAFIEKPFDSERDLTTCISAVKQKKTMKLLNTSINYIMYQFSEIDQILKEQGKESLRITLKNELQSMLKLKQDLKSFQVAYK